jgi:uncharacterized protein YkwD
MNDRPLRDALAPASGGRSRPARFGTGIRMLLPLLLLGLGACDIRSTTPAARLAIDEAPAEARAALEGINRHRATRGCVALSWHARGATVASDFSRSMNDLGFFSHVDPSGGTLKSRLEAARIVGYRTAAELIAAGQRTGSDVVASWVGSTAHRAILEDCQYTHVGVGLYEGNGPHRTYWTAILLAFR